MPSNVAPPREVKIAGIIALGVAVVGALQAINAFAERQHLASGLAKAGQYMNAGQAIFKTGNLRGSLQLALGLGIAAVVLFALLALLLRGGFRRSRVIAWLAAVALIVGELVLMAADSSAVKTGNFVTAVDVPGGNLDTVTMLNKMLVPGWFPPVHYVTELLMLVGLIAVCVQLLRPRSAEFFRGDPAETVEDDRVWTTSRMRPRD